MSLDLPDSLRKIRDRLHGDRERMRGWIHTAVAGAKVRLSDLEPWQDLDYPAEDSYGRRMVCQGPNFEVLVMTWRPGSFSMIHDHGYTQWGAVQVFGPVEHAVFRVDELDRLVTTSRRSVEPGTVLFVPHRLVHQMGNPTDEPILTLHVYGTPHDIDVVTADARMFDVQNAEVQRTSGGVFFALPKSAVTKIEPGPRGDYPTLLRYRVEAIKRLRWMSEAGNDRASEELAELRAALSTVEQRGALRSTLDALTDEQGFVTDSIQWDVLNRELEATAALQEGLRAEVDPTDDADTHAENHDALIGRPSLEGFVKGYLARFASEHPLHDLDIVSVGCRSGLVEEHLVEAHGADPARLRGYDQSEVMVRVARRRIRAEQANLFELRALGRTWDLVYAGLDALQSATSEPFEDVVDAVAKVVRPGGAFLGDFVTSDHVRRYPNLVCSESGDVVSLRTARLVERDGSMVQEATITNVSFAAGRMTVEHVGRQVRVLTPLVRVRRAFERAFGGRVELFDAVSHAPVPETSDTCPSTRYVVHARRAG